MSKEDKAKEDKCKNLPPSMVQKKTLPKPIMRDIHRTRSLNNVYKALIFSAAVSTLFYIFWNKKRKDVYADFYRSYDAQASYERMAKAGVLSSAPPNTGKK